MKKEIEKIINALFWERYRETLSEANTRILIYEFLDFLKKEYPKLKGKIMWIKLADVTLECKIFNIPKL